MASPQPFDVPHALVRVLPLAVLATLAVFVTGAQASEPSRLVIEPAHVRLSGASARQQLAFTLKYADRSLRDVGAEVRVSAKDSGIVTLSRAGTLTAVADGETTLHVELGALSADVILKVEDSGRARPVSYRLDVVPLLSKAGCNMGACHGNLNGKGGFRLSLRGDDPAFDLLSLTRDALGRRIDLAHPDQSLALLKPSGRVPHEGGLRLANDSPELHALRAWIAHGARDDLPTAPRLARLSVFPSERYSAAPALAQQLIVTAEFTDGSKRDVTRQASYDVSDPSRGAVTPDGRVEVSTPSEVTIAVRYLGGRGVSRLAFLPDRPDFVWSKPSPQTPLDQHVFAKLETLKINPSPLASDPVFLRRAYLDAIGLLPTPSEARAFLADTGPDKRSKLVDSLVRRPEFADFWALKWADLLRNEEKTMGEKGVWVFQRWLRDQIAADVPLDTFATRVVSSVGSTWRNPPASFYRTNRDPQSATETVGQVFLGVRLQCARCHNHPFDVWTQNDYYGLAAFFGNIRRKDVGNVRRDDLDKHEINGDEIIYLQGRPQTVQPRSGEMMEPKPPGGPAPSLQGDADALDDLAAWLTRDNPQFARNMANRVWYHLLGRGIVEPVDDFRDSNPPSNPALLDALTAELRAGGMRLKPLVALIMKSRTYQLSSTANATNADDEANFARCAIRLLPAEVLLDALGQALGRSERFGNAPRAARAVQLPGARMGGDFLKAFGKPDRLLTCECERSEATTLAQAFQLINGTAVRARLEARDNRFGHLMNDGAPAATILEELYLASVSRFPTDKERSLAAAYLAKSADPRKAWEDLAWAILNSKEFLLRH